MNEKIDFVIMWVDGSDPKWLQEKNKYHNIYLEYTNGLKQATNDHLNVLEVVNGKAENYVIHRTYCCQSAQVK